MNKFLLKKFSRKFIVLSGINPKSCLTLLFFQLTFFSALIGVNAQTPTNQTFPANSIIIDMGMMPQTVGNGLKPYGLVYALLQAKVPVAWAINQSKTKDAADFTLNGYDYKGGPFIIDARFLNPTINALLATWTAQGVVTRVAATSFTAPVYLTLKNLPRWTLDRTNGGIAVGYFVNAGIPAAAYGGSSNSLWPLASELDCCDDTFVMPHADPIWSTHSRLVSWNFDCRGAIWAACHAVSALENMVNTSNRSQQGNFLTVKDPAWVGLSGNWTLSNSLILWGSHSGGSPPYTYRLPADPISQFMGTIDLATLNGSEQIYIPRQGIVANASTYSASAVARWAPHAKVIAYDPTQVNVTTPDLSNFSNVASVLVYGRGFGEEGRGNVMYEGGHRHNGGTAPWNVAAQRAFFNFGFIASWEKAVIPEISGIPSIVLVGETYPLSYNTTPNRPPELPETYTVTWTSSCGGSFSPDANSPNATFTPPNVASPTPCVITVTVVDSCGRTTFDSEPATVQCNVTATSSVSNACFNTPNAGSITYSVSGGAGPYTYTWIKDGGPTSGNGSGTTISGLSAGSYAVTVTTSNGCTTSFSSTVSLSPEIEVDAIPTPVSCNGGNNGAIDVTVSGGTPGYTYSWSDGPTTANRSGLIAGAYTLTVTDSKGCQIVTPVTITEPTAIIVTPTLTDVTCFDQNNGIINLVVSGGNPGTAPDPAYTFLWNDGNSSQNRTGLAPGTYSVTVTDSKGCSTELTGLTIAQPADAISLSSTQVNVLCFGQSTGSIDLTVTGGTPFTAPAAPYTYSWTRAGGGYTATTQDISSLPVGTYNVTVTDSKGCTAIREVTITQPPVLALSTVITQPTCPPDALLNGFDGAIDLTISGGTGTYTSIVWTAPVATPQGVVPPAQVNNEDLSNLQHGTYTVTVTDSNGCVATTTVVLVAQNPKPVSPPVIKD
jgi:hypothetical protein